MIPENIKLDLNQQSLEHCLKSISNFGKTIYRNICTGTDASVPWGQMEWTVLILIAVLTVTLVAVMVVMVVISWE